MTAVKDRPECWSSSRAASAIRLLSTARREARRTSLLSVERQGIAAAARELIQGSSRGFTAVIASRRSLQDAVSQVPELGGRVTDLPE